MRLVFLLSIIALFILILVSCNEDYEPIPKAESCFDLVYYAEKRDDPAPEFRLDNYKFNSRQILSKLEEEYGSSCFEYEPFNIFYNGIRRKSIVTAENNCEDFTYVCGLRGRKRILVNSSN
jgi:hypothetical protein